MIYSPSEAEIKTDLVDEDLLKEQSDQQRWWDSLSAEEKEAYEDRLARRKAERGQF